MLILAIVVFIVTYPFLSGLYAEVITHIQDGIRGG